MRALRCFVPLLVVTGLAGCSKAGLGAAVRTDISTQMQTISAPVQMCYGVALERNRKLRGVMVVSFRAAPTTGQFEQVSVTRDEVGDPTVRTCVIEQVQKLKLGTPQKTAVSASYPLDFQPSN
jgi:hypothetical protein